MIEEIQNPEVKSNETPESRVYTDEEIREACDVVEKFADFESIELWLKT